MNTRAAASAVLLMLGMAHGSATNKPRRGALTDTILDHDLVTIDIQGLNAEHARVRRGAHSGVAGVGPSTIATTFEGYGARFHLRIKRTDAPFAKNFKVNFVRAHGVVEPVRVDRSKWYKGQLADAKVGSSTNERRRRFDSCSADENGECSNADTTASSSNQTVAATRLHGANPKDTIVTASVSSDGLRATIFVGKEIYRIEPIDESRHRRTLSAARAEGHNHVLYAHSHTGNLQGRNGRDLHDDVHGTCGIGHVHKHDRDARDATVQAEYAHTHGLDSHADLHHHHRHTRDHEVNSAISKDRDFLYKHTCEMSLVADKWFIQAAGGTPEKASDKMIQYIADANAIYTSTQFDKDLAYTDRHLDKAKIQLAVAKVTLFETASGDPGFVSAETDPTIGNPWRSATYTSYNDFLQELGTTRNGKTPLEHDKYCLAHGFTAHDFDEGVLGLAWLGTVCSQSSTDSRNTGMSTDVNFKKTVSYTQAMLVVTHEVGHNFGMNHDTDCNRYCNDDDYPEHKAKCNAGNEYNGKNKFIMWPTSVDGSDTNNNIFSDCSTYLADLRMAGIYDQMQCFTDTDPSNVCGNEIIQGTEECDCGVSMGNLDLDAVDTWTPSDKAEYEKLVDACQKTDPCCLPNCKLDRTANEGNSLDGIAVPASGRSAAECSPFKDKNCCGAKGADDECKMRGVDMTDLKAGKLTPDFDALSPTDPNIIECAEAEDCTIAAYCIKNPQYNGVCPMTALRALKLPRTQLYKDAGKLCNNVTGEYMNTCSNGECQGSLCGAFVMDTSADPNYVPSSCEIDDPTKYCEVGCQFEAGGNCTAVASLFDADSKYANLAPEAGRINKYGEQLPTATSKPAGKPCNNFDGYCQADGSGGMICQQSSRAMPLDLLADLFSAAWIWDNWYVILGLEGGLVLIAFLMRCTNGDHTKDKKQHVKAFVRSKLRGSEFGDTIKARAFGSNPQLAAKASMKNSKRRTSLSQLAVLEAEGEGLKHENDTIGNTKDTAFNRLKVLFPDAKEDVLREIIVLSPHEEAAVARLLQLGYAMWCCDDYKLLRFAARKVRDQRKQRGASAKWGNRHHSKRKKKVVSKPPSR